MKLDHYTPNVPIYAGSAPLDGVTFSQSSRRDHVVEGNGASATWGNKIMRSLGILTACLIGVVLVWQVAFPTYSYRYRLTVSIEIDGQAHTGSSVIEVTFRPRPDFGNGAGYLPGIRGQAVFVDLAARGAVIALLRTGESSLDLKNGPWDATWIAARAFGNESTNPELPDLPRLRGRRQLAPNNMPQFIWLPNIADPNNAQRFRPEVVNSLFGPDARLEAQVEITRDPIIVDIDRKLPWYSELANRQKSEGVLSRPGRFDLFYTMFVGEGT
jgi:hypothetical protein